MMRAPQRPSGLRFLENLAYLVPGYCGYKQWELRREEDSRLRARVFRRIQHLLKQLCSLRDRWEQHADDLFLDELTQRRQQLDALADSIRFAPGEKCCFFAVAMVREETLERILETDLLIFQDLEESLDQVVLGLEASTAPRTLQAFLRGLDEKLSRLEHHLIMRERVLAGG